MTVTSPLTPLVLSCVTDPDSMLYVFDDRATASRTIRLLAVNRDTDQRAGVDLRTDQLTALIDRLTELRDATSPEETSRRGDAVVTNLADLTPTMRALLLRGQDGEAIRRADSRSTVAALEQRGLVIDCGNRWVKLTDAGKRARQLLIDQAG